MIHITIRWYLVKVIAQSLLLVGSLDVVEESLVVLADERFGVVAGDVVPFDTVLVQVVQDSKAWLRGLVDAVEG